MLNLILVFLYSLQLCFILPPFIDFLTDTNTISYGTNCTICLWIIIGLLSCIGWSSFGGKQRSIEQDQFWKMTSFACQHHCGFHGINWSVFFWTFISHCCLSLPSELSLSSLIWLKIDEMGVHLFLTQYCWCNDWILFSTGPKWVQNYNKPSLSTFLYQVEERRFFGRPYTLQIHEERVNLHFTYSFLWFFKW